MIYTPPFTITANILNLVVNISEQEGWLNAPVNTLVTITGLKTPEAIIRLLKANPELTRLQLADIIGKNLRTIGRAITKLQQQQKLTRIGSDKSGYWKVINE